MAVKPLRTYMPRSLYARAALILLLPIITIQLVLSIVFVQRRYEDVTEQMTGNILLEVRYLLRLVDEAPDLTGAQAAIGPVAGPLAINVVLPGEGSEGDRRTPFDLSGRIIIETFRTGVDDVRSVDLVSERRQVVVLIGTRHGDMRVQFWRQRVSANNPHQLLVIVIFVSLLMTIVAYVFLRAQLRPVKRLAAAAEAFGRGRVVPYRPTGANEVRSAGSAFLDMRSRIERQIEQRTLMLSGVSHDLRTPLTRLKLGLSMQPRDDEVLAMERDVEDMERMLDTFLSFARGDALDDPEEVDPVALVEAVVENARRARQDVTLHAVEGEGMAELRPMAVERALENLIGNAVHYGNRAEVSLAMTDRAIRITVEDDGPGIPAEDREAALLPFTRLDEARNQDLGTGVGLGLSIAVGIARQHGGALRLDDSDRLGGLKADLILAR